MPATFKFEHLDIATQAAIGRNLRFTITAADLVAEGATTSAVLTLLDDMAIGTEIGRVAFTLPTPFDGGATSTMVVDVGVTANTDAFIDNVVVHLDGTEIVAAGPVLTAPTTTTVDQTYAADEASVVTDLRTLANQMIDAGPTVLTATTDLLATFTASGGNLNVLTVGEIHIFANVVDLKKF